MRIQVSDLQEIEENEREFLEEPGFSFQGATCSGARCLHCIKEDWASKNNPEVQVKLGAHADIVHSPWFESAVVKILRGQEAELDDEKEKPLMTAYEYEGSISQDGWR
jgi:hypothetical protein